MARTLNYLLWGQFGSQAADRKEIGNLPRNCVVKDIVVYSTSHATFQLILLADGNLYGYGTDKHASCRGMLGLKQKHDAYTEPTKLNFSRDGAQLDVVAMSRGTAHMLALCEDGSVWSWGSNLFGQLGIEDRTITQRSEPTEVASFFGGDEPRLSDTVVQVLGMGNSSFVVTARGNVFGFGANGGASGDIALGVSTLDAKVFAPLPCIEIVPQGRVVERLVMQGNALVAIAKPPPDALTAAGIGRGRPGTRATNPYFAPEDFAPATFVCEKCEVAVQQNTRAGGARGSQGEDEGGAAGADGGRGGEGGDTVLAIEGPRHSAHDSARDSARVSARTRRTTRKGELKIPMSELAAPDNPRNPFGLTLTDLFAAVDAGGQNCGEEVAGLRGDALRREQLEEVLDASFSDDERDALRGLMLLRHAVETAKAMWSGVQRVALGAPRSSDSTPGEKEDAYLVRAQLRGAGVASIEKLSEQGLDLPSDEMAPLEFMHRATMELSATLRSVSSQNALLRGRQEQDSTRLVFTLLGDSISLRREKIRRAACARELVEHMLVVKEHVFAGGADTSASDLEVARDPAMLEAFATALRSRRQAIERVPTFDVLLDELRGTLLMCLDCKLDAVRAQASLAQVRVQFEEQLAVRMNEFETQCTAKLQAMDEIVQRVQSEHEKHWTFGAGGGGAVAGQVVHIEPPELPASWGRTLEEASAKQALESLRGRWERIRSKTIAARAAVLDRDTGGLQLAALERDLGDGMGGVQFSEEADADAFFEHAARLREELDAETKELEVEVRHDLTVPSIFYELLLENTELRRMGLQHQAVLLWAKIAGRLEERLEE